MELKNTDEVEKEISSFSACTEMSKYWHAIIWNLFYNIISYKKDF